MELKAIDQAQIHWKEIEERLKTKGIEFVLYPSDSKRYPNRSGMGVMGGLTFDFILGFDGSALLTILMPETEVQQDMVNNFIGIISEAEKNIITRFPRFSKVIPGLDLDMQLNSAIRTQLPLPRPNLMVKIPSKKLLFIEWGCQDPTSKIEWIDETFGPCEEIAT
ncbi:MAG: hypothetical protein UR96_C0023G0004 [candidate division WS6 bacterium GW2011_GWC1_36_11]|uniref:Uncharacterized protein n=1 Tax=candidate division WS6 bacterium GW2011_GWC1_36_11 TaxID=1619090 RepID=A0A0G0DEY8_9BACT|nr:MAG: hypothetical protein UR96_C0023G0004 [candidate division WS6 bacterium GW2011_GWC1_36_11]HAM96506.1 hypothetical protein [Patescibacteria group bacterium]